VVFNFVTVKDLSEQELINLLRKSSINAFEEIYDRYWDYLFNHAIKKTGSEGDGFDLVQDLFIAIWDKRRELPEIHLSLKYYLKGALAHKLAKYFRKKGFTAAHERNFALFLQQEQLQGEPSLLIGEEDVEELLKKVRHRIGEMPQRMQQIFLLRHLENYSIAEIAEKLQISQQSVKNQISNALLRLRRLHLSDKGLYQTVIIAYWLIKH